MNSTTCRLEFCVTRATRTSGATFAEKVVHMGSRIESIGVYRDPAASGVPTVELVKKATLSCLKDSAHGKNEIDHIIHVSNYRAKEIVEPAMAAVIQRAVQINSDNESSERERTFSFDLMNGALGFLQGVQVIDSLIATGRAKLGLVVSGNTKNHIGTVIEPHIGFCEIGVAALVDDAPDKRRGFGNFYYQSFPEYFGDYESYLYFRGGEWFSRGVQSANIDEVFILAINITLSGYLQRLGKTIAAFDIVIAPQVSPAFVSKVCAALGGQKSKFVDVTENDDDLKAASIPVAMKYVIDNGLARPGKEALVVSVGSGVQVGCATYMF
jgi:3-oxoacyl-[acyl-carrier-protein] synthase III